MISRIEYEALDAIEAARHRHKGQKNLYICPRGHCTVSIDRDSGVTPFMIKCEHRQNLLASHSRKTEKQQARCVEHSHSEMYRHHPVLDMVEPVIEFYRPTYEYYAAIKNPSLREHLEQGGLAARKSRDSDCYQ